MTAIMEIRAQAPDGPDFRAHPAGVDESLRATVRDAVAEGVGRSRALVHDYLDDHLVV